jgi:hypothetical protein
LFNFSHKFSVHVEIKNSIPTYRKWQLILTGPKHFEAGLLRHVLWNSRWCHAAPDDCLQGAMMFCPCLKRPEKKGNLDFLFVYFFENYVKIKPLKKWSSKCCNNFHENCKCWTLQTWT